MANRKHIEWVLRITVAMEFAGHGIIALTINPEWIPFITLFGISESAALAMMPWVGALDILLAISILARPSRPALIWMSFWGFFTASLRPLSGSSLLGFIERGPNWGAPLALLILIWNRRKPMPTSRGIPRPISTRWAPSNLWSGVAPSVTPSPPSR